MKSHKIVNFPIEDFDPSSYLAPRAPSSASEQSVTCMCNSSAEVDRVPNRDIPDHDSAQMEMGKTNDFYASTISSSVKEEHIVLF